MPITVKKKSIAQAPQPVIPAVVPPTKAFVVAEPMTPVAANDAHQLAVDTAEATDTGTALNAALLKEIDALGGLEKGIKAAKKLISEYNTRFGIVRDKLVAAGELQGIGAEYVAEVKEEGNQVRKIKDLPQAIKYLGTETFLKVAKIGLADIDAYLTDAEKAEVIETTESKTRSMKIMKRV